LRVTSCQLSRLSRPASPREGTGRGLWERGSGSRAVVPVHTIAVRVRGVGAAGCRPLCVDALALAGRTQRSAAAVAVARQPPEYGVRSCPVGSRSRKGLGLEGSTLIGQGQNRGRRAEGCWLWRCDRGWWHRHRVVVSRAWAAVAVAAVACCVPLVAFWVPLVPWWWVVGGAGPRPRPERSAGAREQGRGMMRAAQHARVQGHWGCSSSSHRARTVRTSVVGLYHHRLSSPALAPTPHSFFFSCLRFFQRNKTRKHTFHCPLRLLLFKAQITPPPRSPLSCHTAALRALHHCTLGPVGVGAEVEVRSQSRRPFANRCVLACPRQRSCTRPSP
jgi:hypothetical protein